MKNILLYWLIVFIWGSTWFAIRLQVGHAPDEISILYRLLLAVSLFWIFCRIKKHPLKFRLKDHFFFFLLGISMFSVHFLCIYNATNYVVSGVLSVVFSVVSVLSIVHNYVFFREKPTSFMILGAFLGILGLGIFFSQEMLSLRQRPDALLGLLLGGLGTLVFSFGGPITKRNHRENIDSISGLFYGLCYGSLIISAYVFLKGTEFVFPNHLIYWEALLYVAIFGSLVAFFCFLELVDTVGPELASYTAVLLPIIALIISWLFEGYQWSLSDFVGLSFVLLGNVLILRKKR